MKIKKISNIIKPLLLIFVIAIITAGCSNNSKNVDAPLAPTGLIGTAVGTFSIQLAWMDNSDNEDRFIIYRSISGPYRAAAEVDADDVAYLDVIETSCVEASYFVIAVNAGGESATSNRITVPLLCAIPDSLE
jgi:hypothetical protein